MDTNLYGIDGLPESLDRIVIPATLCWTTTGNPTLSFVGAGGTARVPAWLLDAAGSEAVAALVAIPSSWATFHVDLWWSNAGAGAGDVAFRVDRGALADGAAVPAATSVTLTAIPAPAQNALEVTRLLTAVTATPGMVSLGVLRGGTDPTDTLANDLGMVGFVLTKAS